MALSFGIGAVKKKSTARGKKKTTTSKTKATSKAKPKARGAKPTAGSKVSKSGKRYYPSTPKSKKSYTASRTCSAAGTDLKETGSKKSAQILALCKASVKNANISKAILKDLGVRPTSLSAYKSRTKK
jgi:hypothetical protein